MASYVMPIGGTDQNAFLEETENLVLKMLGLLPSQLEFDDDETEDDVIHSAHLQSQRSSSTHSQFDIIAEKLSMCGESFDSDLETDHSSAPLVESLPSHAPVLSSRSESTEEERRIEAAVEKLEKMAEQILCMYKDDFKLLEEDLEANAGYSSFSSFMQKIIPSPNPMWYKISMLFGISRHLVKNDKKKKSKNVSGITTFTVEYIKDNFADYIIENGGWDSVASVSLQEIEGEMFCELPNIEKAAFEDFRPSHNATNEALTDGRAEEESPDENGEDQVHGDSKAAAGSSLFELTPFVITASAAAAVAVAYAVMKT